MKIKVLSDLHLEGRVGYQNQYNAWSENRGEDVLVLAGDIAVGPLNVHNAILYFKNHCGFDKIVYVMGNHELYKYASTLKPNVIRAAKDAGAIVLDANEVVKIDDVSFFGGTLWTNFGNDIEAEDAARRGINDFRIIFDWDTKDAYKEFVRQSEFIKQAYETTPGKKVIVTHFLPARECTPERFKSDNFSILLNKYFANDMGDWISTLSDTTWIFGHTHDANDFMLGDTRMVSNPLGYAREYVPDFAKFQFDKVIEV